MRSIGCWHFQRASLMLLGCITSIGCSLAIDADRQQCADDSECSAFLGSRCSSAGICESITSGSGGGGSGGSKAVPNTPTNDWSCIGKPPPVTEGTGPFTVKMRASNILGTVGVPGATAKVCLLIDVECTQPSATVVADSEGYFTLQLTKNFTGFIWVTPPDGLPEAEAVSPSIFYFNRQPQADIIDTPIAVQMATPQLIGQLTTSLGSPQKDGNGLSLNNIFDCAGKAAEGVTFKIVVDEGEEIPPETTVFYANGSIPSKEAKATTSSGYGGVVNAPTGNITLEAFINVDDVEYKVASSIYYIKTNSLSLKRLVPHGS